MGGKAGTVVRRNSRAPLPARKIPPYSLVPERLKPVVISPVPMALPAWLGTMALTVHVAPPLIDRYTGPRFPPPGLGEKAKPIILAVFAGFTAECGSLGGA